jgi:TonB family protein
MKDAGIGGTARIALLINAEGQVAGTRVRESSGTVQLDLAAERVVR